MDAIESKRVERLLAVVTSGMPHWANFNQRTWAGNTAEVGELMDGTPVATASDKAIEADWQDWQQMHDE